MSGGKKVSKWKPLFEFNKAIACAGVPLWSIRDPGERYDRRSIVCLPQEKYELFRTQQAELIASCGDVEALPRFVARFISGQAVRAVLSQNDAWQTISGRPKESAEDEGAKIGVRINPRDELLLLKTCKRFGVMTECVEERHGVLIFSLVVPEGVRIRQPSGTGYVLRVWDDPRVMCRMNVAGMAVISFRDDKTVFDKGAKRFHRNDIAVPDADVCGVQFFRLNSKTPPQLVSETEKE